MATNKLLLIGGVHFFLLGPKVVANNDKNDVQQETHVLEFLFDNDYVTDRCNQKNCNERGSIRFLFEKFDTNNHLKNTSAKSAAPPAFFRQWCRHNPSYC